MYFVGYILPVVQNELYCDAVLWAEHISMLSEVVV